MEPAFMLNVLLNGLFGISILYFALGKEVPFSARMVLIIMALTMFSNIIVVFDYLSMIYY